MSRARRAAVRALALAFAVLVGLLGGVVVLPSPALAATDVMGCQFRNPGSTESAALAKQLCWLDFSGLNLTTTAVQHVERQVGAYTLAYDFQIAGHPELGNVSVTGSPWDGGAVFGNREFLGTSPNILHHDATTGNRNADVLRFTFSNVRLTDRYGVQQQGWQMRVIDAERTSLTEGFSYDNGDQTFQPPWYSFVGGTACSGSVGTSEGTLVLFGDATRMKRDLVCEGGLVNSGGAIMAQVDGVKSFTVSTYTESNQGVAVALNLGRVGATVTADTTGFLNLANATDRAKAMEKAVTGGETAFDVVAFDSQRSSADKPLLRIPGTTGATPIGPQDGSVTGYLRTIDSTRYPSPLTDTLSFLSRSSGTPGGQALVFQRYTPLWRCTQSYGLPDASTALLPVAGSFPFGPVTYTVVNDTTNGTSRVDVSNPNGVPIQCNVYWQSKFQQATLTLSKVVSGTAQGFPEVQNRQYNLNYSCTLNGFAAAYPSGSLTGTVTIGRNQTRDVLTLPQGAVCTFTETFPNDLAPALPGKRLTVTWTTGATGTWDSIDHPEIYPPNEPRVANPALPSGQATLGPTNAVGVRNTFDYRSGTVDVSKMISGPPVAELANTTKTYTFDWACTDTDRSGNFTLTVAYAADGTASGSAPQLTDVPVERDCWIKPLTGLSTQESARIMFTGRTVTLSDDATTPGTVPADDQGRYHFRLRDYRTTPSHVQVNIVSTYAYQTTNLKLVKSFSGSGAAGARREFGTRAVFPVNYSCTYGVNQPPLTGSVLVSADATNPVLVPNVPLGAQCRVWEDTATAPQGTNVALTVGATTVTGTDANDTPTRLSNDAAQTRAVHTVHASEATAANTVVINNVYELRLGTVSLAKAVDTGGLANLPTQFTFTFSCGERSVVADQATGSVPLTGTATVSAGGVVTLTANGGVAAQQQLVNDGPGGVMRVPYGNICTFAENPVGGLPTGVNVTNDTAQATFTVAADATTRTVTNTFTAAGEGLTITQGVTGRTTLATASTTYALACNNGYTTTVTLAPGGKREIANTDLPEGTTCSLTEQSPDPGTRTMNGGTFPILRTSTATMAADGEHPGVAQTFDSGTSQIAPVNLVAGTIVVGQKSVLQLNHDYDFVTTDVDASKVVAFGTEQWISEARKQVKRERVFTIDLTCTQPDGTVQDTTATVSAATTSLNGGATVVIDQVPVGSSCTAFEQPSTTAEGITLTRQASWNGQAGADPAHPEAVTFTVAAGANHVVMTNTYNRTLATLTLTKTAVFPGNVNSVIRDEYANDPGGLNASLHTHHFTLDCRDPEAGDVALGQPMAADITGEGTVTFTGVPVGAECHLSGDEFTQLDLTRTRTRDGVTLESHFVTEEVDWVMDRNDGTTTTDTDFPGGVTESGYFPIRADVDGQAGNYVELQNHYEFLMTDVTRAKRIVATEAGWELLRAANPSYAFTYRCSGVGFDDWTSTDGGGNRPLSLNTDFAAAPAPSDPATSPQTYTATYTAKPDQVPAGAWCEGTELPTGGTPPELTHTMGHLDVAGQLATGSTLAHRAPGGSGPSSGDFVFVDTYTRRMVPVRLVMMHDGSYNGADAAGYTMTVTCDDPAATTVTRTIALSDALIAETVSADSPPQTGGAVYELPVGATCSLQVGGAAMSARPELELTQGTRTPFVEYGLWKGDGTPFAADPSRALNPDVAPIDNKPYDDAHVTAAMKTNELTFAIDATTTAPGGGVPALTLGAEAMHPLDVVDVTLTKEALGQVADGATFAFESSCVPGRLQMAAGGRITIPGVAVNTQCTITEVDDGVAGAEANLDVNPDLVGERMLVLSTVNSPEVPAGPDTPAVPSQHAVTVQTLPVASTTDTATAGDNWLLPLRNTFTSLRVEKTIKGPTILAPRDTAVLSPAATSMQVTFAAVNDGGVPLQGLTVSDPSLAGLALTRSGTEPQTTIVAADGTIAPAFCGWGDGFVLAAGETATCTFDATLPDSPAYLQIQGAVAMTAESQEATPVTVEASDSYGAIRSVVGALPATGVKTLVLFITAGLLVVGYGLWRSRRSGDAGDDTGDGVRD